MRVGWLPAMLAAGVLLLPAAAPRAEHDIVLDSAEPLEDAPPPEGERAPATWDIRIGALGGVDPDYSGSDDYSLAGSPYLRIEWRERIILHGKYLRANLLLTDDFSAGPVIGLRGDREEDENYSLAGMGDVDRTFEGGVFVRFTPGPLRLKLMARHDLLGEHDGTIVDLSAGVQVPFDKPWFLISGSASWASDGFMSTYYGVDRVQSRRSGMREFDAGAGFKDVGVSLASRVSLYGHWLGVVSINYRRLLEDAADSPLVKDRGDADQFLANVGLLYQF